jgi:hypothetical protein
MYLHVEGDEVYFDWLYGKRNLKNTTHSIDLGVNWWIKLENKS